MPDVATSLHLHNVHELTLLVPVKEGFVQQNERRISYAGRLNRLLNLLFRPAQGVSERTLMPVESFADNLQNIYHFDYGVVERFQQSQLVLSATFDSSWEAYFHNLVDGVGDFLDAVFCHCKGFEGRSCADGYEAFADFIRENQVQTGVLYAAAPDLTTDDLRILRRVARGEKLEEPAADLATRVKADKELWTKRYRSSAWQGEKEYKRVRIRGISQFFHSVWETRKLFGKDEPIDGEEARKAGYGRSARVAFDNVALLLARPIFKEPEFDKKELGAALLGPNPDPDRARWLRDILERVDGAETKRSIRHDHKSAVSKEDVQGNILDDDQSNAAFLTLLRFPTADQTGFLRRLRKDLTYSDATPLRVNAGFTFGGLRRLGLGDETLELFPKEFQEGMEARAGTLGDVGWPNHPDYWRPYGERGWFSIPSIDLVVVFHGKFDASGFDIECRAKEMLRNWVGGEIGACLVHFENLKSRDLEPFGFKLKKKAAQPEPVENYKAPKDFNNEIAYGDLILGYPDRRGEVARIACDKCNPTYSQLFKAGSFMVVRKLAQHADAFKRFQKERKSLGRESTTLGKFLEAGKVFPKRGEQAYPRISHRRRANPRLKAVPRVVRRGFSYRGPSTDNGAGSGRQEQGHLFVCYNASIAQQYEMLQRWINGGNGTKLLSTRSDLAAGQHVPHTFPISAEGKQPHIPHVTLRWGMYLFVPSKSAVEYLEKVSRFNTDRSNDLRAALREADAKRQIARGEKLLEQLDSIRDEKVARDSWKQLFEEPASAKDSQAVWAAIRKSGGRKETPYGNLVGDPDGAKDVLEDTGKKYSVSEYRTRFKEFGGDYYLGLDAAAGPAVYNVSRVRAVSDAAVADPRPASQGPTPSSYQALASANKAFRTELTAQPAFDAARRHAAEFLARSPTRFEVPEIARQVVGKISQEFIGLPRKIAADDAALRSFLDHFINVTRYSSFPHPETWVRDRGIASGKTLNETYGTSPRDWTGIGEKLATTGYAGGNKDRIRDAILIGNIGFVPPAVSMLAGMLTKWLNNGDIEQPLLRDPQAAREAVIREMRRTIRTASSGWRHWRGSTRTTSHS